MENRKFNIENPSFGELCRITKRGNIKNEILKKLIKKKKNWPKS